MCVKACLCIKALLLHLLLLHLLLLLLHLLLLLLLGSSILAAALHQPPSPRQAPRRRQHQPGRQPQGVLLARQ